MPPFRSKWKRLHAQKIERRHRAEAKRFKQKHSPALTLQPSRVSGEGDSLHRVLYIVYTRVFWRPRRFLKLWVASGSSLVYSLIKVYSIDMCTGADFVLDNTMLAQLEHTNGNVSHGGMQTQRQFRYFMSRFNWSVYWAPITFFFLVFRLSGFHYSSAHHSSVN